MNAGRGPDRRQVGGARQEGWWLVGDSMRVGVIGVGAIAEAIVTGVVTGPDPAGVEFRLSPRGRSQALASRFEGVTVEASNQAVVDNCDVVVICVLPDQVQQACRAVRFREGQTVVGVAAGWPPSALAPLVLPATDVCQIIPLPMASRHEGPIAVHRGSERVHSLLAGCGELVDVSEEADMIAMSCASAVMSSFFEFEQRVAAWLVASGLAQAEAWRYTSALFVGLAKEAADAPFENALELAGSHETPSGLNAQLRSALTAKGAFSELEHQLSRMRMDRLHSGSA